MQRLTLVAEPFYGLFGSGNRVIYDWCVAHLMKDIVAAIAGDEVVLSARSSELADLAWIDTGCFSPLDCLVCLS
jgi:hypothetical protein